VAHGTGRGSSAITARPSTCSPRPTYRRPCATAKDPDPMALAPTCQVSLIHIFYLSFDVASISAAAASPLTLLSPPSLLLHCCRCIFPTAASSPSIFPWHSVASLTHSILHSPPPISLCSCIFHPLAHCHRVGLLAPHPSHRQRREGWRREREIRHHGRDRGDPISS
jgi:hypothetical protein